MHAVRIVCVFSLSLVACLAVGPRAAAPPASRTRGMAFDKQPSPTAPAYRKRWALVVGIDYADDPEAKKSELPPLRNAERDALAVRAALRDYFGYDDDSVVVLLGSGQGEKLASRDNIAKRLRELKAGAKVKEDDSILVFFAGHGLRRRQANKKYFGEIVPARAKAAPEGGAPLEEEALPLTEVRELMQASPARHKLLVLDCCHAGELFNLPFAAAPLAPQADVAKLLAEECFFGAASCRSAEHAADGRDSNSPFTAAMLRMLTKLSGPDHAEDVKARDLFSAVALHIENGGVVQRPVAGPLSEGAGDFVFRPTLREGASWPARAAEGVARTLPGSHGGWWFDEMPWLVPGLRGKIVQAVKARRSASLSSLDKDALETAAEKLALEPADTLPALGKRRLAHLQAMLRLRKDRKAGAALCKLADELAQEPKNEAEELHLLALIEHRLERDGHRRDDSTKKDEPRPGVSERYRAALAAYARRAESDDALAVHGLCLSDYGCYLSSLADYDGAQEQFKRARAVFPVKGLPVQFEVHTLCLEADAYLGAGNWDAAHKRLTQAEQAATYAEGEGALFARAKERRGWAYFKRWEVDAARACFAKARQVRLKLRAETPSDFDSQISALHDWHGEALALRFQGKDREAVEQYEKLLAEVRKEIEQFEEDGDRHVDLRGYRQARERLTDRLGNSLERLGDCLLFGQEADPAEAARFYLKVRAMRHELPAEDAAQTALRLRYKLAICRSRSPLATERHRSVRQYQQAHEEFRAALEGKGEGLSPNQAKQLDLLDAVADGLVHLSCLGEPDPEARAEKKDKGPAKAEACPRRKLEAEVGRRLDDRDQRARLDRDEIELMLFAAKALVHEAKARSETARPTEEHPADKALTLSSKLCRLVQQRSRRGAQAYLRPTYDLVFTTRLSSRPGNVKGLLDLVALARAGREHDGVIKEPVLSFYFTQAKQGYALLDVPGGASKVYLVYDDVDHARQQNRPLRLPAELTKELGQLKRVKLYYDDAHVGLDERAAFLFPSRSTHPDLEVVRVAAEAQARP